MARKPKSQPLPISGNPKDLPQSTHVWHVAIRSLGFSVENERGQPTQPYILAIGDISSEKFMWLEPLESQPDMQKIQASLWSAMLNPNEHSGQTPARPLRVEFEQPDLLPLLSGPLWEIGVSVAAASPLPIIDAMMATLSDLYQGKGSDIPGMLSVPGVTPKHLKALYEASELFNRAKPWEEIDILEVFKVSFTPGGENLFLQVFGQEDNQDQGLVIFQNWDDVVNANTIFEDEEDADQAALPEAGIHSLSLVTKDYMPTSDLEAAKQHKLKPIRRKYYPLPMYFDPKGPQRPSLKYLVYFEAALRALPLAVQEPDLEGEFVVDTAEGKITVSIAPTEEDLWDYLDNDDIELDDEVDDLFDWDDTPTLSLPLSPANLHAAQLCAQAWEEDEPKEQLALAKQALAASPDYPDSYLLMGFYADSLEETIDWYQRGIEAGKRLLAAIDDPDISARLQEDMHQSSESRTLLYLHKDLAETYIQAGQPEAAVKSLEELVQLDPGDSTGSRHTLISLLLRLKRDQQAAEHLAQLSDMDKLAYSGINSYLETLLLFRQEGDSPAARQALAGAFDTSPLLGRYLAGLEPIPAEEHDFDDEELDDEALEAEFQAIPLEDDDDLEFPDPGAVHYAHLFYASWIGTPGMQAWMRKQLEV